MTNIFKPGINRLQWVQTAPSPNVSSTGTSLASDLRNDGSRNPYVYSSVTNATLNRFNIFAKAWERTVSPALAGTFGAGATSFFVPSFGAVGTIAAGATTTSFTLSTALPTAVGVNILANRGAGASGFKVRIIDTVAGKTEERYIVANTAGTTPLINVDAAFTFTPSSGARYEILAGRLFMLSAGTLAAGAFKSFEISSNTVASRSITNLPGTVGTDSAALVLDELYVPFDCAPGEGMVKGSVSYDTGLNALQATATTLTSLTGQATGGDSVITTNEYRNFQIRIVQDTVAPSAVGQRRIIASHTAGASPVYTLGGGNWAVQPSSNARYVIEQPNLVVLRTTGVATTYTYNYTDATVNNGTNTIASDAWSTTYFATSPGANGAGNMWAPSFGIQPDVNRNARHSFNYFFRGSATTLDLFDIAGSATGTWTGAITYDGSSTTLASGSTGVYVPFGFDGRFFYINAYSVNAINQIFRFDVKNRVFQPYSRTTYIQTGTAVVGSRMAAYVAIDGTDKYGIILLQAMSQTITQELIPLM